MIAHITHGSNTGGVINYLTGEVAEKGKKSEGEKESQKDGQAVTGKVEKQSQSLQAGGENFLGKTADGHSQYPRQSRLADLDDDYEPNQRWRVIGGNLSVDPEDAVKELETIISYRPDIEKPVWHASLSSHSADEITTQKWREIGKDFLNEMGFRNTPYIIIQHRDRAHDHIHLVTSRVDVFGSVNDAWQERLRGQEACVRIEQNYRLKKATRAKAGQIERKKQTFFEKGAKNQTQKKIAAVLNSMTEPNVPEFIEQLEQKQILVETKFSDNGDVYGLTFTVREEAKRRRYLKQKTRQENREREEQRIITKSVGRANAKSENQVQLTIRDEKTDLNETITFAGGQLGDACKWENLKSHLNYSPKDDAMLISASRRAAKKEFQIPKKSESGKLSSAVAETLTAPTSKSEPNPVAREFPSVPVSEQKKDRQTFGAKIRLYIPKQIFGFTVPVVEPNEKTNFDLSYEKAVNSIGAAPQDNTLVEGKTEKPQPTISTFDLAVEKQQMAAEISEVFRGVGQQGFLLAGDEILQLNLDLRTKEIYSEFFLNGRTITGIRFSKHYRKTGEVITFKGSELNITFLQWCSSEDLAVKTSSAAPKSMFSERRLSPEIKDKIIELNAETVKLQEGSRKVSRDAVFQANAIDAKANQSFINYFENLALPASELEHKDLISLNRIKQYFLNKEKFSVTTIQNNKISRLYKNIEIERKVALEKITRQKKMSGIESANESAIDSPAMDSFTANYNFREKIRFFERSPKTALDAELLISNVLSRKERFDAANDLLNEQTTYYRREQPLPPVQKQIENYFDAINLRVNERELSVSSVFNASLNDDLRMMSKISFLQTSPLRSDDLNDLLIPEGIEFLKIVAGIKARGDWEKYDDKEAFQDKLKAATFILANGNQQEKDALLDRHIENLSERETEILEPNIFTEAEIEPPTAEQVAFEPLEM